MTKAEPTSHQAPVLVLVSSSMPPKASRMHTHVSADARSPKNKAMMMATRTGYMNNMVDAMPASM